MKCEDNDIIHSEEKKFYYRCNMTNEEGDACEICIDEFELNKNGLCIDKKNCLEKNKDDTCKKCKNEGDSYSIFFYCLNNYFGCVENLYNENCVQCNDIFDFEKCTKCEEGYILNEKSQCIKIQ